MLPYTVPTMYPQSNHNVPELSESVSDFLYSGHFPLAEVMVAIKILSMGSLQVTLLVFSILLFNE